VAERSDVHVEWWRSPRVIVVEAPSITISVQDLVDTIRGILEPAQESLDDKPLLDAGGKEALGGASLVSITATLQNAQLAFEQRVTVSSTGTTTAGETTNGLPGVILTDGLADFVSDLIEPGDVAFNNTDGSLATVIERIDATHVKTYPLTGGSDDTWESGDGYSFYHVVECDIKSGNLVAVDDVGDPIPALISTAFTTVSKESSSSGTTQELEAIQYSSYQNAVWVDTGSGISGIGYPIGTREFPVDNIPDAVLIANVKGFDTLQMLSNITLGSGDNVANFTLIGRNATQTALVIGTDALTLNCEIRDCTVSGVLDGGTTIEHCHVGTLNYVNGEIHDSILLGIITLGGSAVAHILNCFSGVPGQATPTIDCGGAGQPLALRGYNGGIRLINKTGADAVSIDMATGQIILESTVTGGTIVCRGTAKLTDNSNGATVDNELINPESITIPTWDQVYYDSGSGDSGTVFPFGTISAPVDDFADAILIAANYNLYRYSVKGAVTPGQSFSGYSFFGAGAVVSDVFTLGVADTYTNCGFERLYIAGAAALVNCQFIDCLVDGITVTASLLMEGCGLYNTITLGAGSLVSGRNVSFGSVPTIIDFNGVASTVSLIADAGTVQIVNAVAGCVVDISAREVTIILDASCTGGLAIIKGTGIVTDNSAGMTVIDTIKSLNTISAAVWDLVPGTPISGSMGEFMVLLWDQAGGRRLIDEDANQEIFYKADNVTEVMRFNLLDVDGNPAYQNVFERVRV